MKFSIVTVVIGAVAGSAILSSLDLCQGDVVADASNRQSLADCVDIKGDLTVSDLGEAAFPRLTKIEGRLVVKGLSDKIRFPGERKGQLVYQTKEVFPKLLTVGKLVLEDIQEADELNFPFHSATGLIAENTNLKSITGLELGTFSDFKLKDNVKLTTVRFAMADEAGNELDIVVKDNPTLYNLLWFGKPHRAKNLVVTNSPIRYMFSNVTYAENVNIDLPAATSVWFKRLVEVKRSIRAITAGEVLNLKSLKKVGDDLTLSHGYTFMLNDDLKVGGCARLAYPQDKESICLTNQALIARGKQTFTDSDGHPIRPDYYE